MKYIFSLCVLGLCALSLVACNKQQGSSATAEGPKVDSTVMKNKEGCKQWMEAFNSGNWDAMEKLTDPNIVEHSPAPGQKPGRDGMMAMMKEFKAAFPDMKMTIVDMTAEGDKVSVLSRMEGTNSGQFMGMPATGKKVDVMGMDLIKITNGKASEHWGYMEMDKFMQQMGMMPPPPGGEMKGDMKKGDMKKKG